MSSPRLIGGLDADGNLAAIAIDANGNIKVASSGLPTNIYTLSDIDPSGYYGYVDKNANWYIQQTTTTTIRYIKGTSGGYLTNWGNRATLTYDYFYNIFNS